jgi:hypothetical protein
LSIPQRKALRTTREQQWQLSIYREKACHLG